MPNYNKDSLGMRMKNNYENRSSSYLPRRAYAIMRIDGKAFHTYTRGFKRPFDEALIEDMDATACYLCQNIMGAQFAFVQSDEISILISDFKDITSEAWFNYSIQKMCSVSASMATTAFNKARLGRMKKPLYDADLLGLKMAEFDSRVFSIADKVEVFNYFVWRQQDATRNSIQAVAQSLYSQKVLHKADLNKQQELIFQKGINWNDYPVGQKRGRLIIKMPYTVEGVQRTRWQKIDPPIFSQDPDNLLMGILIPDYREYTEEEAE